MADQPRGAERAPLWPGPSDVAARLDRVEQRLADLEGLRPAVESALVAQAARIETILAAARRDLAEVAEARLDAVQAAVADTLGPTEALADAVASLRARVVEVADDLAAHHDAQAARVEDRLAQGTADALTEVRSAGTRVVEELVARLDGHVTGLQAAVASVTTLQASLQDRLDALDREAGLERSRLAAAFAEQLADGLSKRERRRLAKRLEVPGPAAAGPSGPSAPVPAAPELERPRPPARLPEPPSGAGAAAPEADEVPTWESLGDPPVPAPRPARVQPSRRARPVRPATSDPRDPAAVRRALAAVRGLGPARQSALMDRFGTLAAIREATDEELLEVPGIGPALLDGIREAAGGERA